MPTPRPLVLLAAAASVLVPPSRAGEPGDRTTDLPQEPAAVSEKVLPDSLTETLDTRLQESVDRQGLVGLQATVTLDGRPIFRRAYGLADLDHGVPMSMDTRLPIASVTKALTGALYLRLRSAELIDPGSDVRALVPEFEAKPEGTIRLEHLVGQTHGIRHYRDEIYPGFFATPYPRLADALPIFATDPLVAAPGERYTYSSYAYTLLGIALERAAETEFEALLRREVLDPIGLADTLPNAPLVPIERRASVYSHYGFQWPFPESESLIRVPTLDFSYNAAGGYYLSTTDDLARFANAVLDGSLLGEEGLARLRRSQTTDAGEATGWSHGWFAIDGGRELRINGSNPGSWAHLRAYPEDGLVIALATNTWGRGSREPRSKGLMPAMTDLRSILEPRLDSLRSDR